MVSYNKTYSYPIELHNSIQQMGKTDLKLENQFKTYRSMLEDSVVSGSTSFIKSVLNRPFKLKAPVRATDKEKQVIEALNKSLEELQPYSFNRTMNNILSLVEYGTSLQEFTFHRKGGFQVFKTISPISLQSVNRFVYDRGYLKKLELNAPENDGLIQNVAKAPKEVSGDKVMVFSFQADNDNPLGKSLLRGAYSVWKEKQTYRELNLVGASKSLSGVMKIEVPSEYLQSYFTAPLSDQAVLVDNLVSQAELMGQGRSSFVCIPSDVNETNSKLFSVDPIQGTVGNGFEIESSIARCNRELFLSLQSAVLSLGQDGESSGSYGLSSTKSVLLNTFLESIQSTIASEFMKAVRLAYQLNGLTDERLPSIVFDELTKPTWEEFTSGMKDIGQSGLVRPTPDIDGWMREYIGAPTTDVGTESLMARTRAEQERENENG